MMLLSTALAAVAWLLLLAGASVRAAPSLRAREMRDLATMEYMVAMTGARPFCFIENGFDYVANDIGSALALTADDCCLLCVQKEGCRAFSWTNLSGGTCWFKSSKGTTVTNASVKSSVV